MTSASYGKAASATSRPWLQMFDYRVELLHETIKSSSVNEQQALAQLDKVLEIEREIKRLHIGLAVRLKNRLTPEQQEELHKWHDHQPPMPGHPETPAP